MQQSQGDRNIKSTATGSKAWWIIIIKKVTGELKSNELAPCSNINETWLHFEQFCIQLNNHYIADANMNIPLHLAAS